MKYVKDLLAKINMLEVKGINTLMFSSCNLDKHGDDKMSDPFIYRSLLEALQYVTLTRVDIEFCVNRVCQYLTNPLDSHWTIARINSANQLFNNRLKYIVDRFNN